MRTETKEVESESYHKDCARPKAASVKAQHTTITCGDLALVPLSCFLPLAIAPHGILTDKILTLLENSG